MYPHFIAHVMISHTLITILLLLIPFFPLIAFLSCWGLG